MTADRSADPTEQGGTWRPLRLLLAAMDADIARIYAEARITELAESVQRTHSATSQKVAAMRAAGLVRTATGADARTKKIILTAKARRIAAKLAAEWRATEAAVADIENEIPYPISRVVTDIEAALRRQSFHDRIAEKLAADPDWK